MKLLRSWFCLLLAVILLPFIIFAQDNAPSLGDLARQARERKQKAAQSQQNNLQNLPENQNNASDEQQNEIAGLKPADFKAAILITESHAEVEKWVLLPAAQKPNQGRLREVNPDKRIYIPFVVTDYPYPSSEKMDLTVHARLISPSGKILLDKPKFSENVGADPRSPNIIVLNPVMDITFDQNDSLGTYTVQITITDHVHSTYARAEETVRLVR